MWFTTAVLWLLFLGREWGARGVRVEPCFLCTVDSCGHRVGSCDQKVIMGYLWELFSSLSWNCVVCCAFCEPFQNIHTNFLNVNLMSYNEEIGVFYMVSLLGGA